jgi:glycosyltransferase involved in cell wall biosynthesis
LAQPVEPSPLPAPEIRSFASTSPMKLISVITSLDPAGGGPVECALQLHKNLAQLGHSLDIATMDRAAAPWNKKLTFEPICLGNPSRDTTRIQPALINFLRQQQHKYDGSVFHGIWGFAHTALRLAWNGTHPYAVFCHGMLDPYFIKYFPLKHIKKSLYYRLITAPVLKNAHAVLFTCEEERRLASTSYRPVVGNRVVVRYGINPPSTTVHQYRGRLTALKNQFSGKQVVLFIGRIHPKKGCDLLIEALSRLAEKAPSLHLVMAGPDETGWSASLKKLAQDRGIADRITWLGPVYGDEKWYLYNLADVSILPSHMENFGMTVAESLSQGLPVLVSDKVNIFSSIVRAEAGYAALDTIEGTISLLDDWLNTPQAKRLEMRADCRRLFENEFQAMHTAEDLVRVFESTSRPNGWRPSTITVGSTV